MNDIVAFQSYVLESAYRSKRTDLKNYITKSVKIYPFMCSFSC